jgi:hypothetical protein
MRLRLKIIQDPHFPAFAHKQISDVRADQARATGDERAFHFVVEALYECLSFQDSALGTSAATNLLFRSARFARDLPAR